jgi:hypothetical protein
MWVQLFGLVWSVWLFSSDTYLQSFLLSPLRQYTMVDAPADEPIRSYAQLEAFMDSASPEELDRRRDEVLGVIDQLKAVIRRASLRAIA